MKRLGRHQTLAVAAGQDWQVRYEGKKTGRSEDAVKRAAKKAGTSGKNVDSALRG